MNEDTLKLRKTVFGGFRSQDVVNYIEANAREHAAQQNALRAELKQVQDERDMLKGEKARADEMTVRCEQLTQQLEDILPLEGQITALQEQAERDSADAEAYRQLRDMLADIELDARTSAAELLRTTQAEAEEKRTRAQAMLDQLLDEYSLVSKAADLALGDVIDQLTSLRSTLAEPISPESAVDKSENPEDCTDKTPDLQTTADDV